MRVTKHIWWGILAIVFSANLSAGAFEPPNGFLGMRWGEPPAQSIKIIGPSGEGTAMYAPNSVKPTQFLGLQVKEEAYFYNNGRFYSGSVWLEGQENFARMKAALFKKYGYPTFANDKLFLWKWQWPEKKIEVQLNYQAKTARATVSYTNNGI
jgi:hypothetical protein